MIINNSYEYEFEESVGDTENQKSFESVVHQNFCQRFEY